MEKSNKKNNSKSTNSSAFKYRRKSAIRGRNVYGYRPSGDRTSDGAIPPNCGTSVQNMQEKKWK